MVHRTIVVKTLDKIPYVGEFIRIEDQRVILKPSKDSEIKFSLRIEYIDSVIFANGSIIHEGFCSRIEKEISLVEGIKWRY